MKDWKIFKGTGRPHNQIDDLPPPPPWRDFSVRRKAMSQGADPRGRHFIADPYELELVNAALYLRRPILITGPPGSGKSTLAYAIAYELQLGSVLRWSINSRSTLQEGLYSYDALARLREIKIRSEKDSLTNNLKTEADESLNKDIAGDSRERLHVDIDIEEDLGLYLKLGPLGTALLPQERPRVLLIDEIDKADFDLPNDLLHVFEEGEYEIPELKRISSKTPVFRIMPADSQDDGDRVPISKGVVRCTSFPIVVLTSNEDREMSPAFRRRCLRLKIESPDIDKLLKIIEVHLKDLKFDDVERLVANFVDRRDGKKALLATDQLLNAVFLLSRSQSPQDEERDRVLDIVLEALDRR